MLAFSMNRDDVLRLRPELLAPVALGPVSAARDHERQSAVLVMEAEMQSREPAHGEPDDVGALDTQVVEHRERVEAGAVLGVALGVLGYVRRRISARVVGDAAVRAPEVPDLRLPCPVVAGELVDEEDRLAAPRLFVVERNSVVGPGVRHGCPPLPHSFGRPNPRGGLAPRVRPLPVPSLTAHRPIARSSAAGPRSLQPRRGRAAGGPPDPRPTRAPPATPATPGDPWCGARHRLTYP